MRSLSEFIEQMDHEFESIGIKLTQFGFKIDGENNGLKKYCKLNEFKSVDYIYKKKDNTFPLVEFSDIGRQQNQILLQIDKIKGSNLDRSCIRNLVKSQHKIIHDELVKKYKDTLSIINRLHVHVVDIPDNIQNIPLQYFIVVPSLHIDIKEKKIDVIRFLDDLETKITLAMPDQIYKEVKVIIIDNFASKC